MNYDKKHYWAMAENCDKQLHQLQCQSLPMFLALLPLLSSLLADYDKSRDKKIDNPGLAAKGGNTRGEPGKMEQEMQRKTNLYKTSKATPHARDKS